MLRTQPPVKTPGVKKKIMSQRWKNLAAGKPPKFSVLFDTSQPINQFVCSIGEKVREVTPRFRAPIGWGIGQLDHTLSQERMSGGCVDRKYALFVLFVLFDLFLV